MLEVYIIIKTPQLTKYNRLRSQRVPTQNYGGLRVCSTHGKVLGKTASTEQYRAVTDANLLLKHHGKQFQHCSGPTAYYISSLWHVDIQMLRHRPQ